MSSIIAALLKHVKEVHDINETLKTAEKAKVFSLKQKAKQIFDVNSYVLYNNDAKIQNNILVIVHRHVMLNIKSVNKL